MSICTITTSYLGHYSYHFRWFQNVVVILLSIRLLTPNHDPIAWVTSTSSFSFSSSFRSTIYVVASSGNRRPRTNRWWNKFDPWRAIQKQPQQPVSSLSSSRPAYVLERLNVTTLEDNSTGTDTVDHSNNTATAYHENTTPATIYYFGIGSNMLRSKLENRGINGTTIELMEMEPAYVPNYRLAFNMKGFPPLEPGMGVRRQRISHQHDPTIHV
jgi:hypothetical protein